MNTELPTGTVTYDGRTREVYTWFEYPPIPDRSHDYGATFRDYDLGDHIGWGPTPEAAIDSFLEWIDMDYEYKFERTK